MEKIERIIYIIHSDESRKKKEETKKKYILDRDNVRIVVKNESLPRTYLGIGSWTF